MLRNALTACSACARLSNTAETRAIVVLLFPGSPDDITVELSVVLF
jgi:hypothetical protein